MKKSVFTLLAVACMAGAAGYSTPAQAAQTQVQAQQSQDDFVYIVNDRNHTVSLYWCYGVKGFVYGPDGSLVDSKGFTVNVPSNGAPYQINFSGMPLGVYTIVLSNGYTIQIDNSIEVEPTAPPTHPTHPKIIVLE